MLGILVKRSLPETKTAGRSSFFIAHQNPDELRRSFEEVDKTDERESNSSDGSIEKFASTSAEHSTPSSSPWSLRMQLGA